MKILSEFKIVTTQITSEALLIESLEACYGKGSVEVHKELTNLYGYMGDERVQQAHIVVRKQNIGGGSNDLGFVRPNEATNRFTSIIGDYDRDNGQDAKINVTYNEKMLVRNLQRDRRFKNVEVRKKLVNGRQVVQVVAKC